MEEEKIQPGHSGEPILLERHASLTQALTTLLLWMAPMQLSVLGATLYSLSVAFPQRSYKNLSQTESSALNHHYYLLRRGLPAEKAQHDQAFMRAVSF